LGILIEAKNLFKSFWGTKAVDGLSLDIAAGEIYGLVGPDGAGKTTTLRLLCGALDPDHGGEMGDASVRICGFDLSRQADLARAQIGYLPQRFSLYEDLTVVENLRFLAEARGLAWRTWGPGCLEILKFVGLEKFTSRLAGYLSGGMKQKLALAAALVHQPRVLLLDEPTTGVDPVTRQDFWQLILRLVGEQQGGRGVAVLVTTPYMDEAARCTRVGFMRNGRLLVEGRPAELRDRLAGSILELRGHNLLSLRRIAENMEGIEDVQMFGDRLHLRVAPRRREELEARIQGEAARQGVEIAYLRPISPLLEDVFISLVEN
jgi:ABC-2 type transport system ATP-binding protein